MKTALISGTFIAFILSIGVWHRTTISAVAQPDEHSLQQRIVSKEREELDSLKTGNIELFSSLLADDAVFVDVGGADNKANVVKRTADFRLTEYAMDDIRFVSVSANSGLIVYKLAEKGTSHGKEFAGTVYVSALWAERSGHWVCLFSQETAAT